MIAMTMPDARPSIRADEPQNSAKDQERQGASLRRRRLHHSSSEIDPAKAADDPVGRTVWDGVRWRLTSAGQGAP